MRTLTMAAAAAASMLLASPTPRAQQRRYVDAAVASPGNGASWTAAFRLLEQALAVSAPSDEVWVATGTYRGGFVVPDRVQVVGGFRAGDVLVTQRSVLANPTVLDGRDLERVLVMRDRSGLDGFIVENGNAGEPGGGALLVDGVAPVVRNSIFRKNRRSAGEGSALLVLAGATPTFENCLFVQNTGGGHVIYVRSSGGTYSGIVVHNNDDNGLFMISGSFPRIVNSVFARNTGRGICDIGQDNKPSLTHSLFFGNTASLMHYRGVEYHTIAEINAIPYARANVTGDPAFVDAASLDYRPAAGSPLVDAGDTTAAAAVLDLAGASRLLDGDLDGRLDADIGALERAHVDLALRGEPRPGNMLRADVTGTAGLFSLLAIGASSSAVLVDPFGYLLVSPTSPLLVLPAGAVPSMTSLQVPPEMPSGARFVLQALGANGQAGNLSNLVDVRIR